MSECALSDHQGYFFRPLSFPTVIFPDRYLSQPSSRLNYPYLPISTSICQSLSPSTFIDSHPRLPTPIFLDRSPTIVFIKSRKNALRLIFLTTKRCHQRSALEQCSLAAPNPIHISILRSPILFRPCAHNFPFELC
jgi:hypothetical protein